MGLPRRPVIWGVAGASLLLLAIYAAGTTDHGNSMAAVAFAVRCLHFGPRESHAPALQVASACSFREVRAPIRRIAARRVP